MKTRAGHHADKILGAFTKQGVALIKPTVS